MKCSHCKKPIAAGIDATKMVVGYREDDGEETFFGFGMPAGPLTAAKGRLTHGFHHKCFHILRKREARGDSLTGRVLAGAPSGYDMDDLVLTREETLALGLSEAQVHDRTGYLTTRLEALRDLARSIGKGVGDPTVLEAFWAREHDGPYPHRHRFRQEMYQLRAHLVYAHGVELVELSGLHLFHDAVHRAEEIAANRRADPDEHPPAGKDWREQNQADI